MMALISIYAFMLIPVWIPLIAVFLGYVGGLFRRTPPSRVRPARGPHAAVAPAVTS
jgi:hypothetical protein